MRQIVFEKTLAIFADLLKRDLTLDVGNQTQPSTNGQIIYLPETIPAAGIRGLCYPLYVTMEHELAHLIFNTDFFSFIKYRESKENKELASWCYNMAEDERIESCWNLIYRTPFRHMYKRLFILPNVRRGQQLTTMDVCMDVRGDFIRNKRKEYLVAWKEIRTILDGVVGLVTTTSTIRVADELYNYFMRNGMLVGGKCDLVSGRRNMDKMNKEGHKELKKIRIDPSRMSGGCNSGKNCSNQQMSESDYRMMRDLLNRYGNYFKHDNIYPDKSRIPSSSITGVDGEKQASAQFLEDLKKQLLPDYVPIAPEKRVIGDIEFTKFSRGDPMPVDKSVKSLIPFKRRATRWYSDVGEFDPDEYVQRLTRDDLDDIDFFEDTINVKGMDIVFLVDYSGSMAGYYWGNSRNDYKGKEFYLKQAIYSLWKSVETIPGINVQTIIFSGGWGSTTPMEIIKDPEECLKVRPGGSTHTYRALDYVHRVLERRKDKRRVVFLITDGEPTPDNVVKNPFVYVKTVIERMRKSRIDLFTIFIDSHAISDEKMKYFGNKTNCLYLPPEEMERFLKVEVAKLVRNYTKSF